MNPVPPPPPPPPPTGGVASMPCVPSENITDTRLTKKGFSHRSALSTEEQQARKAYQWFIRDKGLTEDDVSEFVFISNYKPVKPVIQNGPLCGMVALAMASELAGGKVVSTEDIFEEAKRSHFSAQGEMFSASHMQKLASRFLDCDVKLVALKPDGQSHYMEASHVIIKALLQHNLILLPYDADKNHGPCQALGHKAHWALITGFITVLKKNTFEDCFLNSLRQDGEMKNLYHWDRCGKCDINDELLDIFFREHSEFRIYSHQGKSKYCGTWNLMDMLESNNNLLEPGPERNAEEYLLPLGGVEEGLRCKAVFICPTNTER